MPPRRDLFVVVASECFHWGVAGGRKAKGVSARIYTLSALDQVDLASTKVIPNEGSR